MLLVFSQAST